MKSEERHMKYLYVWTCNRIIILYTYIQYTRASSSTNWEKFKV